jgi:Xaa-Pro aminopeptidase
MVTHEARLAGCADLVALAQNSTPLQASTVRTTDKQELPASSRIGIDPTLIPYSEQQSLSTSLSGTLVPIEDNFIDQLWTTDKPPRPSTEIFLLDDRFTGENVSSKLLRMREILAKTGARGMVVSQLDEVAWLFNLRASDIPYNPVSRLTHFTLDLFLG